MSCRAVYRITRPLLNAPRHATAREDLPHQVSLTAVASDGPLLAPHACPDVVMSMCPVAGERGNTIPRHPLSFVTPLVSCMPQIMARRNAASPMWRHGDRCLAPPRPPPHSRPSLPCINILAHSPCSSHALDHVIVTPPTPKGGLRRIGTCPWYLCCAFPASSLASGYGRVGWVESQGRLDGSESNYIE